MYPVFKIKRGLSNICPGARYIGVFVENNSTEYGLIEWLDVRTKPDWLDVEEACLISLRQEICNNINDVTRTNIIYGFRTSISLDTPIVATSEWQFDTLNLYLHRDAGLFSYPYELHVGSSDSLIPTYITLADSSELQTLYLEMFNHVNTSLTSGRVEKSKLQTLTRTGLEEYRDSRYN